MAFVKIWVHSVWGTKNREPILTKPERLDLFQHIKENAEIKGIYLDFINGYIEHVHTLISLDAEQSISKVMQLIKGEASYWANKNSIFSKRLVWADEYYAVSVSESQVEKVREYIRNQEVKHKTMTWSEECELFMTKYGFSKFSSKVVSG
jgi:putative transposase